MGARLRELDERIVLHRCGADSEQKLSLIGRDFFAEFSGSQVSAYANALGTTRCSTDHQRRIFLAFGLRLDHHSALRTVTAAVLRIACRRRASKNQDGNQRSLQRSDDDHRIVTRNCRPGEMLRRSGAP